MIAHIVFFKLKDPTEDNMRAVKDKLLSMKGKLHMLRHIEAGTDLVRSERSFDVALYTQFETMEDLNEYQVSPYHAGEVVPFMKSVCSAIHAVDYEI